MVTPTQLQSRLPPTPPPTSASHISGTNAVPWSTSRGAPLGHRVSLLIPRFAYTLGAAPSPYLVPEIGYHGPVSTLNGEEYFKTGQLLRSPRTDPPFLEVSMGTEMDLNMIFAYLVSR